MNANLQGSVKMLDGLLSSDNQGMPGILRRARSSNAINKPLSGDVLRAFDDYNKELADVAQGKLQLDYVVFLNVQIWNPIGVQGS